MLQPRELATIRAALQFWQEEICPYGPDVARPYLDEENSMPLTAAEVEELRDQLTEHRVRYAIVAEGGAALTTPQLLQEAEVLQQAGVATIATVLLPILA